MPTGDRDGSGGEHHGDGANPGSQRDEVWAMSCYCQHLLIGPTPVAEGTRRVERLLEGWRGTTADHLRGWLGPLNAMEGRFEDARAWIEESRALIRDLGLRHHEGIQDLLSAYIELLAGDPAAATRELRAANEVFIEIGDRWYLSTVAVELPAAVYAQGRYDDAAALAEAIEDAPAPNDLEWQIKRRAIGAKLLARGGDLDRAESLGREAVALVSASDFLGFHGDVLLDLAEVLELADRSAEAATAAEEAVRLHERKGNVVSAGRARTRAAELRGAGK